MSKSIITILGDYVDPENIDFEGSLTFRFKSAYLEKRRLWKSKDISAEFLGDFWETIIDDDNIKSTLHFVCAELLENAVDHGESSDYLIMIHLCFKQDELLVYVKNNISSDTVQDFKQFIQMLLKTDNLQDLFVQRMISAKKNNFQKSQVGLITILKDRGAKLSWKFEQNTTHIHVVTLAKISLNKKGIIL
ncbi:MAG: hypothetical protein HQK75_20115 [Candidatus Magnetomorum sp.]|nr:hypothetical protein [Candidatus Magnetomorum sp.]